MRNNDFCDVPLVSADNNKFVAQKVILAAYSHIFKNMLVNEKHPHPVIYLRGLSSEVLGALLDFIYCGEAKITNEDLDLLIQLSTDIELMGLTTEAFKRETKSAKKKIKTAKPVNIGTGANVNKKIATILIATVIVKFTLVEENADIKTATKGTESLVNIGTGMKTDL
jgi:hypothetical protein